MVILCWKCDWVLVRKNDLPKHIGVITYVLSAILLGVVFFAGIFGKFLLDGILVIVGRGVFIVVGDFFA